MSLWSRLHLNIRQKVTVGLTACILGIGFIGGLSYHYLARSRRSNALWRSPMT